MSHVPKFIPRLVFDVPSSVRRSNYQIHHHAALQKMRRMLQDIDQVIDCRDYRAPLTTRNPLLEDMFVGKRRIVVYTKKDLGRNNSRDDQRNESLLRGYNSSPTIFLSHNSAADVKRVLEQIKLNAAAQDRLTSSTLLVVGMPNVGKSTLLNALRVEGMQNSTKAAATGAHPGVTKRIARNGCKIVDEEREGGKYPSVYLMDTPGVSEPYVSDAEAMMKLALCGIIRDAKYVMPSVLAADYLLYHLNRQSPELYAKYCKPTNDILEFLHIMGIKTNRLQRGGEPNTDLCAKVLVQEWRKGGLGRFILDEVNSHTLTAHEHSVGHSSNSVRRASKALRQAKAKRGQPLDF